MFSECLKNIPPILNTFQPCAQYTQREQWQSVALVLKQRYITRGEKYLTCDIPALPISLWLEFSKTGNRSHYQAPFFKRRRMLNDLVLAECCEGEGRFMSALLNTLYTILAEPAWWIPAENVYIRDAVHDVFPDPTRPIVALFSAETGAMLAMVRYLFADVLDAATIRYIDKQLEERIITPYLTQHFWWMGSGDEPMCNWTPWCTQNVLFVTFTTPQSNETRSAIVKKAAYSLDCFLKDYGEDGCCNEGASYFKHAGLAMMNNLEILTKVAGPAFDSITHAPKIQNMLQYILNMNVAADDYFNFADCDRKAGRRGVADYRAAKRLGNANYQAFAAKDFADAIALPDKNVDIDRVNLWELTSEAMLGAEMLSLQTQMELPADIYYESVGLLVARDAQYSLAVKAGGNGDSHNHNDTGSITLYKNGKPFLIDLGRETYTQQTFSPQRYEIWLMQSAWHNLPTFDGVMQHDGAEFAARNVFTTLSEHSVSIGMDIAGAYPEQAKVNRYCRTVTLEKGKVQGAITMVDETDYQGPVTLSLLFSQKPEVVGNVLHFVQLGQIILDGAQSIVVEEIALEDAILTRCWSSKIYRVLVQFEKRIGCSIT